MAYYEKDIESLEIRVIEHSKMLGEVYVFSIILTFMIVFLMIYIINQTYYVNGECDVYSDDNSYLFMRQ